MNALELPVLFHELRKLCTIHGRVFDEMLGETYAETLADVPIKTIVANAHAAMLAARFPRPVDLMAEANVESPEVAAVRAWTLTRPHFARHTLPADPIAREVVRLLGGSAAIGGKDSDEVERWVRREFLRLYIECTTDAKRQEIVRAALDRPATRGVGSGDVNSKDGHTIRSALPESALEPRKKGAATP